MRLERMLRRCFSTAQPAGSNRRLFRMGRGGLELATDGL
jgi:hypothetical protein